MSETINKHQLLDPYCRLFEQRIQSFPGALPVAVTKANKTLLHYGFLCALKADGERVFAIVTDNTLVLHFRDGHTKTFELSMKFQTCLFDCEFVRDTNTLLIFDTLICNERPVARLSIEQRIEIANFFLSCVVPRNEQGLDSTHVVKAINPIPTAYKWARTWNIPNGPDVRCKPLYNFHDAATLWHERRELSFVCDGLIFTRLLCVYSPFNQNPESVFKWKPHVTVDFFLLWIQDPIKDKECRLVDSDVEQAVSRNMNCFLHPENESRANYRLFAVNDASEFLCVSRCHLHETRPKSANRCVGEFQWLDNRWKLEKIRADKKTPNHLTTILSSFHSILDNLRVEDLIL